MEKLLGGSYVKYMKCLTWQFMYYFQMRVFANDTRQMINMTEEELQKLVDMYYVTEEEIGSALTELRNHGKECDCSNPVVFKQIHEGDFDEIINACLKCGGIIE